MGNDSYKGNRAGAVASGAFVAGAAFLLLYLVTVFLVVLPEGNTRNPDHENIMLFAFLGLDAFLAGWLGWKAKRFLDRRAGRG